MTSDVVAILEALHLRIQQLQPENYGLQPILEEISLLLPGNEFERHNSLQQLEEAMRHNQGLVLKRGEQILALLLYYLKGNNCRISFAYALRQSEPHKMLHYLLQGLISLAQADKNITNIRCDVVPWFPVSVEDALCSAGFTRVERMVMRRVGACPPSAPALPGRIKLVPWDTWLTGPAAQILHLVFGSGYEGTWDRSLTEINGCKQFIADCYSGRFGTFDPAISFALQRDNLWVGLAMATWSSNGEGFIPSFGLLPQFTGQGLGSIMLEHLLKRYGQSTFPPSAIELAVSEENKPAVQLYHKFGFKIKSRFQVYYLNL